MTQGYGLAMLVEVLGGVLGDANYGRKIRTWQSPLKDANANSKKNDAEEDAGGANLGQAFIVVDPAVFGPGFPTRMDDFIEQVRKLKMMQKSHTEEKPRSISFISPHCSHFHPKRRCFFFLIFFCFRGFFCAFTSRCTRCPRAWACRG